MSKNRPYNLMAALLMLAVMALTACTSIDDNPTPADDWRSEVPEVAKL